jgi:DNA (cytosine-5)-methyltransferase 1
MKPNFYEFFAGGGMARAGLGAEWDCSFANDFDEMKGRVYRSNWSCRGTPHELIVEDINNLTPNHLPGQADLAWASFPCQDLSLAGNYLGIGHRSRKQQTRSGTFWPFWKLMRQLGLQDRAPHLIVLENVYGALTSNDGQDFGAIASAFSGANYRFGAMIIDAQRFLPHSRPRLFIVGVRADLCIPSELTLDLPSADWHPKALIKAYESISLEAKKKWIWWHLPIPAKSNIRFADLIEEKPSGVSWHSKAETTALLAMMNKRHLAKVEAAKGSDKRMVGAIYKRTRIENGVKFCRAEIRFDDTAGCLRTPSGGSSRQSILVVDGESIRSRLLSPREAARLMGLSETYKLPVNYNDAYHLAGDGVAVPVVRYLAAHIFEPVLIQNRSFTACAAAE